MAVDTQDQSLALSTKKVEEIMSKENLGLKKTKAEYIWFDNQRGVRKANLAFAMTQDELTEYAKCKYSVKYFSEAYCRIKREDGSIGPMTLRDYQKDIIDLYVDNRFAILCASRQSGKCVSHGTVVRVKGMDGIVYDTTIGEIYDKYSHNKDTTGYNTHEILGKITDFHTVGNLLVETDYGFVGITEVNRTIPMMVHTIETSSGLVLRCADDHVVYTTGHAEKFVSGLVIGDELITVNGLDTVTSITIDGSEEMMYDLTVDGPEPSYYTGGILSHNTVSAAIVLLHFALFNSNKGIMIVANKGKTVQEIVRKIKDIYLYLPFYMKKGVFAWNEMAITFDNGCRIQSEKRTASPAIGFSIDLLYLDEFAKIPNNIAEAYYGAVVPTVSSIENSKIIITSTPEGFNLFHKLLTDAQRDDDDPLKNPYSAMMVYWWQIKGRKDTRLFPLAYRLKEYDITEQDIIDYLEGELKYKIYRKKYDIKVSITITSDDTPTTEISHIRTLRIKNIPLVELCTVTNWKEEEIKLIGTEDQFNQEYGLQFVTGDKLLFDSDTMMKMKEASSSFEYIDFPVVNRKIKLPYNKLRWLKGKPEIFNVADMKNYHVFASVDLGEGLGGDYSVINIFRLMPKSKEEIDKMHGMFKTVYDYFCLEQIGMFRVNHWSIAEFAELFYVIMFDLFDPEKCKVVLEFNKYGGEFVAELPHVFNENNSYSSGVFLRYKHRAEDQIPKIGIKISAGENDSSKKILIKNFQDSVKKCLMKFYNDININEISMFIKKETNAGNFTFSAESGHDDTVMSVVNLASVFSHTHYKSAVEEILNNLPSDMKSAIEKYAFGSDNKDAPLGLESFGDNFRRVYRGGNVNSGSMTNTDLDSMYRQFGTSPYGNRTW